MAMFVDWFFTPRILDNEAQRTTLYKVITQRKVYPPALENVLRGNVKAGKPISKSEPTLEHLVRLLSLDFIE